MESYFGPSQKGLDIKMNISSKKFIEVILMFFRIELFFDQCDTVLCASLSQWKVRGKYVTNFYLCFQLFCVYYCQKLSTKVNFDIFSSFQFSKIPQIFKYFCSCAFLRISANLDFIACNLH